MFIFLVLYKCKTIIIIIIVIITDKRGATTTLIHYRPYQIINYHRLLLKRDQTRATKLEQIFSNFISCVLK